MQSHTITQRLQIITTTYVTKAAAQGARLYNTGKRLGNEHAHLDILCKKQEPKTALLIHYQAIGTTRDDFRFAHGGYEARIFLVIGQHRPSHGRRHRQIHACIDNDEIAIATDRKLDFGRYHLSVRHTAENSEQHQAYSMHGTKHGAKHSGASHDCPRILSGNIRTASRLLQEKQSPAASRQGSH